MQRRRSERGEGRGGCIVALILLLAAVFVAYKMIPVKIKAAELRETVVDEGKSAGMHNDQQIHDLIMAKANELKLPLTDDGLHIVREREHIRIEADYTVPIKFPGYVYNWKFHHVADNPVF
jgi:hypothetical protein